MRLVHSKYKKNNLQFISEIAFKLDCSLIVVMDNDKKPYTNAKTFELYYKLENLRELFQDFRFLKSVRHENNNLFNIEVKSTTTKENITTKYLLITF